MKRATFCMVVAVICMVSLTGCGVLDKLVLTPELVKQLKLDKDDFSALLSDQHAYWSFMAKLANAQKTTVEVPYGAIAAIESYRAQGMTPPIDLVAKATIKVKIGAHMQAPPRPPKTSEVVMGGIAEAAPFGFGGWIVNSVLKYSQGAGSGNMQVYNNGDITSAGRDLSTVLTTTTTETMTQTGP